MKWTMINNKTLVELKTDFTIELLSGCWLNIVEIRPSSPENLDFLEQARLLRHGLEYAETQVEDRPPCPLPEVTTIYNVSA